MSENKMKDRIGEEVKIAKETGKITSKKIHEIIRKAVADAVSEAKGGAEEIRPIVADALSAAVEGLRAADTDVAENIKAALEGAVDGVRVHKDQAIDVVRKKIRELEAKLETEKAELAQSVNPLCQ